MKLHLLNSKKFKTTVACLLIRQPLRRETATLTACIPGILMRGCDKYPTIVKMNMALEKMYGSIFNIQIVKKGEEQIIQFYIECLAEERLLEHALKFLAEVMHRPLLESGGFQAEHVASEKELLKAAIASRINNKAEYARLRCLEEMFKAEPFGIYADGYLEDVDNIDGKSAYELYQRLLRESKMDLLILGPGLGGTGGQKSLERLVNEIFGVSGYSYDTPPQNSAFEAREMRRVSECQSVGQAKLCSGYRAMPETSFYDLLVMNEILGGGASSCLFTSIREKEQLCYYINSCAYRFKNFILIQCGTDSRSFDRVIELTESALETIKNGRFSDVELSSAKQSLAKKFRAMDDYQTALLDFYISQQMLNDTDGISEAAHKVLEVNRDGVKEAASGIMPDTAFMLEPY